jgi:hypothetical protein
MNAETSSWGRALIAVGAADAKKGIASANEVRNAKAASGGESKPAAPKAASKPEPAPDPTEFKRAHVTKLLKARKVPVDHLKAFLVELGDYSGLSAVDNVEHLDSVRNWVEQAYPEGK